MRASVHGNIENRKLLGGVFVQHFVNWRGSNTCIGPHCTIIYSVPNAVLSLNGKPMGLL